MELIAGAIVPGLRDAVAGGDHQGACRGGEARPDPSAEAPRHGGAKRVHTRDYIDFLPTVWPPGKPPGAAARRCPSPGRRAACAATSARHIEALLGFYSFDAGANFVEGTWDAIKSSMTWR
jgi:hypothetical protein